MAISSNVLTFIDTTDTKKIDVHITSNHPTVQIFDTNKGTYTPNWNPNVVVDNVAGVPLKLSATVLADSLNVTDSSKYGTEYQWFKDKDFDNSLSSTKDLTIPSNILEGQNIVEYTCKATYNNKTYENKIVLTLIATGKNGVDGQSGKDGVDGKDGTSVTIEGVAYAKVTPVTGSSIALYSDVNTTIPIAGTKTGESYLVNGYLCVYNTEDGEFICTGKIQGPQGQPGESTYLFTRYADDQNGSGFSTSPIGKKYIGFYRHSESTLPSTISTGYDTWMWVKYVGDDAKSISLNATTQVFRVDKEGKVSPSTLTVTPQAVNTSINKWEYNTNGGTFSTTPPAGVVRGSDGKVTVTGASMTANSIAIRMGDDTYSDTLTVYKVYDGDKGEDAPIVFLTNENITFSADSNGQVAGTTVYCDVVAYIGTTKVTPTVGVISSVDLPDGMSIGERTTENNQVKIPIIIADNTTLGSTQNTNDTIKIPIISPVETDLYLTWSKVNSGAKGETGVGIKSTTTWYGVSDSASIDPNNILWQSTIPTVADGKYLWTKAVIDYTDDAIDETITYTYAKQGVKGETGSPGSSVTVSKIEYQAGTSATIAPTGTWSNSVVAVTEGGYLWTKTTFSDNKVAYGVARQGANGGKGDKGDAGRGVSSIVEEYYQSTSATAQSGGSWSSTVPTWVDGKYIWTRSVITYTDFTSYTTSPICITGQKGATGGTGASGVGINSVDVWYYQSSSATSLSGGSWATTAPTWVDGKYIWTKTITTYTNNTTDETNAVCITGQKGSTGVGVKSVTEYYLATASSSGITTSTSGWTTTVQTITVDKKYLWNYEVITYTNDTTSSTSPIIIGVFGNTGSTGATGKGIKSVTEYYLATASSSNVTTSTSGWTTTMQTLTATKKYLWNYELITYTDNSTATINPVIIGVYGDQGVAAVSFQVYAPNGYLLTKELESLTLKTLACEGSTVITSGATYQWSQLIDDVWTDISEATEETYEVTRVDVVKAKSYRCVMTYKGETYISTVTVQDTTDIYESVMYVSSNVTNNEYYWVLYTLVYTETGEVDSLLGPVSIDAPSEPDAGDYWYALDITNMSVKLKQYDGTSWVDSTDTQSLSYSWDIINNGSTKIPLSGSAKVKVISRHNFTATATIACEVSNSKDGLLTQASLSLTDASDPIISDTEPTATVNGQIWIQPSDNGTYLMFIWDESLKSWIAGDMDTRNKVYTSKPSSYNAGDLWVTASDVEYGGYYALATTYSPNIKYYTLTNGAYVLASSQPTSEEQVLATQYYRYVTYLQGTMLQAQVSNTTYNAADWSPTLKYHQDLDDVKATLNDLSQYVTITSSGLRVAARDDAGKLSEFTSLFTSEALTFYQGSKELLILANNQLTAPKVVIEDELEVQGEIKLGDLKIIIEGNGSFSFAIEK